MEQAIKEYGIIILTVVEMILGLVERHIDYGLQPLSVIAQAILGYRKVAVKNPKVDTWLHSAQKTVRDVGFRGSVVSP